MPHIHGCAWIHDDIMKNYYKEGTYEYDTDKLPELVNKIVTCELPWLAQDLPDYPSRRVVQDLQSHTCSKTCKKKGTNCRFNYPRMPSEETIISLPIDKDSKVDQQKLEDSEVIIEKMRNYLQSEKFKPSESLRDILQHLKISPEAYKNALRVSKRGKQVVLKRKPSECAINNYNSRCLEVFQSNMDIQFCTDAYAVCTYVCDYWSKGMYINDI